MTKDFAKFSVILSSIMVSSLVFGSNEKLIDYKLLSHEIQLVKFRAGNHDPDGQGEYKLKVTFWGLENSEAERKKEFKDRKKVEFPSEKFGKLKLDNLSFWAPEGEEKDGMKVRVEGDRIRSLLSQGMTELKKKEHELVIAIKIELYEEQKKYFVLGEEKFIMETMYYPLPPTKYDPGIRNNQKLKMKDDVGTLVLIDIKYDNPVNAKSNVSVAE